MISALIFDMDDLIVDTSKQHFDAYYFALKKFGIKNPKIPDDMKRSIYGMRISEIMELLAKHFNIKNVKKFTRVRNEYFMNLVKNGIKPMPGLFDLVDFIKHAGLKRALATSGLKKYAEDVMRQLNLSDFFDASVTGDEVKNPKPAPDTFLIAAQKLGAKPADCAVLEDAEKGIEAAKAAGMYAIGVQNPVLDTKQNLSKANQIVHRLNEVISIIED